MSNIVIIEDNPGIRKGFTEVISSIGQHTVTGNYSNCEDALKRLAEDKPDVVLMDIDLPGMNGIEGTIRIKKQCPICIVLIITVFSDSDKVFQSLCAGASGYLVKNANLESITGSINEALAGGAPMSLHIAKMVVQSFKNENDSLLTERERQVLQAIAQGKSYAKVAQDLFISYETVRSHIKNIYSKLSVNNRSAMMKIASERKWISKW